MASQFTAFDFFRRFPDDDACLDHLMKVRYGERPTCPRCRREAKFYRLSKERAYSCEWCGHHIHPMAGTPFERSRTPLQKWFYAMYLFTTSRHGVPAKELQRQLGVTYKAAWRMGHQLRKYMAMIDGDDPIGGSGSHVEADETMVGGVRRGGKRGRGAPGRTTVFGMLERHVIEKIKRGSTISTDELASYRRLASYGYKHSVVNHAADEYARGPTHVNALGGFWSQLKRSIRGTHVHISRKHLPKYLREFEFRYNMQKVPDLMLPRLLLSF